MNQEKEIKIELNIPLDVFLKRIEDLGFGKEKEITQRDNYFDTEDWHLYKSAAAMRVRQVNGIDHSFAFKKMFHLPNRDDAHYIEEIEGRFPLSDEGKLKSIFDRLGIRESACDIRDNQELVEALLLNGFQGEQVLQKTRLAFRDSEKNEVVIDDVDHVGTIIELECEDKEPLEVVKNLLQDSEWKRSTLGTSYIWLDKVKGFNDHLDYENKFTEKPDWNVWDNEREMYEGLK